MNVIRSRTYIWQVVLCLVAVGGCGRDARLPELVPLEGQVTLDGQPLSHGSVTFLPSGDTKGRGGAAITDENGRYELEEQDGTLGVVVGSYRVVVSKLVNPDGSDFTGEDLGPMDTSARELLPAKYSDLSQSELTAEVPPGGGNIDFQLTSE